MLGQRRRRWPNIKSTFFNVSCFQGQLLSNQSSDYSEICSEVSGGLGNFWGMLGMSGDMETITKCWVNVGPASETVDQDLPNNVSTPLISWYITNLAMHALIDTVILPYQRQRLV